MNKITIALLLFIFFFMSCEKETVERPEKVLLSFSITDASAFNANDGAISISIEGGSEPFRYFWSTGENTRDISGLYAGEYSVKVLYGGEGEISGTVEVEQPEPDPLQVITEITAVSRYGKSDATAELRISGGTGPYTATWVSEDTTALSLSGLSAGVYTVEIVDSSEPFSITATETFEITQPEFVCVSDSIADVDGNVYPTVLIANQCWMAENLRVEHLDEEGLMPIDDRFCGGTNCINKRGPHYTWEVMMNGDSFDPEEPTQLPQGICPDGFGIPSRKVFLDLDSILSIPGNYGDGFFSGPKLKGEDSSTGFDALFAGNWGYGVYNNTNIASFWAATPFTLNDNPQQDTGEAYYFILTDDTPFLSSGHRPLNFGMSVRCVKIVEE